MNWQSKRSSVWYLSARGHNIGDCKQCKAVCFWIDICSDSLTCGHEHWV